MPRLIGQILLSVMMTIPLFIPARAQTPLQIAFIDPALPKDPPARNAAALAFARTQGQVTRISPSLDGGWRDEAGAVRAPEEFDVVWFHEADSAAAAILGEAAAADLLSYLEGGGALLVSGAAGRLIHDMGIEPTAPRVLGPTGAAFVSGIRVIAKHRSHPAFAGMDASRPILLTSKGGNALADFYGTAGPHGELLAEGNATSGERPLVEYRWGSGCAIFIGWRLPDFTTADDAQRPNLEKLFGNMLRYLAQKNTNRARLIRPDEKGPLRYARLMGIPFLRAAKPVTFSASASGEKCAAWLAAESGPGESYPVEGGFIREAPVSTTINKIQGFALTMLSREKPVSQFVARRRTEQGAFEQFDKDRTQGMRVIKPEMKLIPAPLKPSQMPPAEQSVLLGRSAFMAPGEGKGDIKPVYEPIEDGGFRIAGSRRQFNRPIVHGQNRIWTGDAAIFRMDTVTGNGSYAKDERVFPLWPRPDAQIGNVNPCMGVLRLGVPGGGGARTLWLDEMATATATIFRPGYTEYQIADPALGWKATVVIAPALDFHGFVCRVEFDKETALTWQYGGVWWESAETHANQAAIRGSDALLTEKNLPNGLVVAGWDGEGQGRAIPAPYGQQAEFTAAKPRRLYHIAAAWGVTSYDEERARKTMARLDTPATAQWPKEAERLKQLWFDCYIRRALDPEKNYRRLMSAPNDELKRTREWWDRRREEFQIRTPDPHLTALINWARCITEHHRQGPGLVLGGQIWQMYSHISTGWYGKQWGGDHEAMADCLRFYGAMQDKSGFIRWISPSLVAFNAENNTAYWVDQVWFHYAWTGDRQFVKDLWPHVREAVSWMRARNDPDGDG
ncbi:MAG: DUF4450 domain-containing protein, partial [Candidatus Sumerlaeota bacterium]|nr:DUF4450 domain-containing protein [Candidatus Sumerlaeota bacterium]